MSYRDDVEVESFLVPIIIFNLMTNFVIIMHNWVLIEEHLNHNVIRKTLS